MFYLSGNVRGSLLGVKDTEDNVEEFYTREFLIKNNIPVAGLNYELEYGDSFEDEYFIYRYVESSGLSVMIRDSLLKESYIKPILRGSVAGLLVTSLVSCFEGLPLLTCLDLSEFDTSNVKNMARMFVDCANLRELNLNNFDTRRVINMSDMFRGCISLKKLDLSHFNTCNVRNVECMFCTCGAVYIDIRNFELFNRCNMTDMFTRCRALRCVIVNDNIARSVANKLSYYTTKFIVVNESQQSIGQLMKYLKLSIGDKSDNFCLVLLNYNMPCDYEGDVTYFNDFNILLSKMTIMGDTVKAGKVFIQRGS